MKSLSKGAWTAIALYLCISLLTACSRSESPPADDGFADDRDRVSYVFGTEFGRRLELARDEIDTAALAQGIIDVFEGRELKLEPEEATRLRQEFAQQLQERAQAERSELAERNLREGEAFLAENAERSDITVTASGLQYRVVREADGPRPRPRDRVRVHYHGSLIDGTVFDSSVERGEPAEFPVSGVIQGWIEALQLMPVGSAYQLFVPSHLGYREQGSGRIGPNATLIFDVELLEIVD